MTPKEMMHQIAIERMGVYKASRKYNVRYPGSLIRQAEEQNEQSDYSLFDKFIRDSHREMHQRAMSICDEYVYMDSSTIRFHPLSGKEYRFIKISSSDQAESILRYGEHGDTKLLYANEKWQSYYHINNEARKLI